MVQQNQNQISNHLNFYMKNKGYFFMRFHKLKFGINLLLFYLQDFKCLI